MTHVSSEFDLRLRRIDHHQRRQADQGVVHRVTRDGLIVTVQRRRHRTLPLQGLIVLATTMIGFKAFLLTALGSGVYLERLAPLQAGSWIERAGAWVMQVDPATARLAEWLGTWLH